MPAEELFEYFDFENRTYFYHITGNDVGKIICDEETDAAYIVPSGKVLGYIDLTSPDYLFIPNPNCYSYELEDMPISL